MLQLWQLLTLKWLLKKGPLKMKEFAPHGSKFFPLEWTHFLNRGRNNVDRVIALESISIPLDFSQKHLHDYLYGILEEEHQSQGLQFLSELTRELHIWPDYHGNRSPLADHTLKGMVNCLDFNLNFRQKK